MKYNNKKANWKKMSRNLKRKEESRIRSQLRKINAQVKQVGVDVDDECLETELMEKLMEREEKRNSFEKWAWKGEQGGNRMNGLIESSIAIEKERRKKVRDEADKRSVEQGYLFSPFGSINGLKSYDCKIHIFYESRRQELEEKRIRMSIEEEKGRSTHMRKMINAEAIENGFIVPFTGPFYPTWMDTYM